MKIAFHTLGCKVNMYETEALTEAFRARGWDVVSDTEFADVYIVNTCSVTSIADRKSRQYIRRMKGVNPESIVAVTGCYSQVLPGDVAAVSGVDIVTGTNEKSRLPEIIEGYIADPCGQLVSVRARAEMTEFDEMGIVRSMENHTRAYIKIQEGCDRFCSYCIIPYARGPVRSRNPENVVSEARALIEAGFREIVLTGINTALYGTEDGFAEKYGTGDGDASGIEVIIKAVNELPGDFRIRLSSLEPTVVSADYVKRLFAYDKLCHHLHLSVQSGSDSVIRSMNRNYTRDEYLDIVRTLREFDPQYGITTDIIVGFPGETEKDFEDSLDIVRKSGFLKVHGFPYSRRPGTVACDMKNQISPVVKKERMKRLSDIAISTSKDFFKSCVNMKKSVLFEELSVDKRFIIGYTDNYIRVYADNDGRYALNDLGYVKLVAPYADGMRGE